MLVRETSYIKKEIQDIVIADLVLTLAFALTLSGGIYYIHTAGFAHTFIIGLEISFVAVTLSFVLHELMHKFVAQHFGAVAGFRTSDIGLIITLFTGAMGFLFGIPGATMIYASNFTKKENGIVSLAGPLTNFVVFGVFFAALIVINPPVTSFMFSLLFFTVFISLWLAFFNMLPIFPLDGSKVLAWNKLVYVIIMSVIVGLLFYTGIVPYIVPVSGLAFVLIIAVFFSMFYRNLF